MIDLNPNHLETVKGILAEHAPHCEARAFGSRATWTAKDYSDLDLAVVGEGPLDLGSLGRLKEAFEESDLPIRVDVLDWHGISESFQKVISREYVIIRRGNGTGMMGASGEWRKAQRNLDMASEWRKVNLGDCATLVRETVSPVDEGDVPYIGLEHIAENKLSLVGYGNAGDVISAKLRFKKGDILFGKLRPYFRKVVRAPFDGICSTDIWVIRAKEGVEQGFLFYCFASQPVVELATSASEGTRMPRANWNYVSQYEFPLPPLPEQRRIAHILGALDDKIELNRRMNATLEQMARALFKSWFIDFDPVRAKMSGRWRRGKSLPGLPAHLYDVFPSRLVPSELGEAPEGWGVKALGELIELAYGKALKSDDRQGGNIPVYGSNGQVGWHDEKLVSGPGIVVGRKGKPGAVAWTQSDFFPIDTTFYVVPSNENQSLHFLFYALTNQDLPSIAADSAVPGLNRNMAYMNKQLVPDKVIMDEFSSYANTIFTQRHHLEEASRTLAALRDIMLPRLVSGEVRVSI